ncbi:MAG: hypothetical protein M3Q14_00275 [bacterium]|nr:hypothetical protein [bacterium]
MSTPSKEMRPGVLPARLQPHNFNERLQYRRRFDTHPYRGIISDIRDIGGAALDTLVQLTKTVMSPDQVAHLATVTPIEHAHSYNSRQAASQRLIQESLNRESVVAQSIHEEAQTQ